MHPLKGHMDAVSSVGYSLDGTHIVSCSLDKTIRIWDARTGEEVMHPLKIHTDAVTPVHLSASVTSVHFSPDGTHIVSHSWDHAIQIWDLRTGEQVLNLKGHTLTVNSVHFSPDGTHIVSGSSDKTIRIWNARTGQEVIRPLKGHTDDVVSVRFSPNGTHIVSGSGDNTIRVWDVRIGEEVMQPLKGHAGAVNSVAFSPDGTHIVSGSIDQTIRIWDVTRVMRHVVSSGSTSILRNLQPFFRSDLCCVSCSDDGWIRGSHQELILWVLPEWRKFLQWHPCILIIGQSRISFDPLQYVHGPEWIRCISN